METSKRLLSIPRYRVDLDAPAEERWNEVLDTHMEDLQAAQTLLKGEMVGLLKAAKTVLGWFKSRLFYIEELKAISKRAGLDINTMMTLQLAYEAAAHCTSIVVNDSTSGKPLHVRTMDWEMDILGPLTIEVEFIKNGAPIAIGTTWVGYLGMLTGINIGSNPFSVSVNFRDVGDSFKKNLSHALGGSWPIGFLVRETLTDANASYQQGCDWLKNSQLIAPVYFTVAGADEGQGCIITRNREEEENPTTLDETNTTVIQTNIDHWDKEPEFDICRSLARTAQAKRFLHGNTNLSEEALWELMGTDPIMSEITVYAAMMSPAKRTYETRKPVGLTKAFAPKSETEISYWDETADCRNCSKTFYVKLNVSGHCSHTGQWHGNFSDCSYVKCAFGLGAKKIGNQHWGCCFGTDQENLFCSKSSAHKA